MDEESFNPDESTFQNGNEVIGGGDSSTLRSQLSSSTFRVVDRHGFMSSSCDSNGLSPAKSGDLSPRHLRKRESKWLEMFEHWPELMARHYEKVFFWIFFSFFYFNPNFFRFVLELVKEFLLQFAQELGSIYAGLTIMQLWTRIAYFSKYAHDFLFLTYIRYLFGPYFKMLWNQFFYSWVF